MGRASLRFKDFISQETTEAIRALYERYRTAYDSELYNAPGWNDWLNVTCSDPEWNHIESLVDVRSGHRETKPALDRLNELDISEILGFCNPRLRLRIHRRGALWLVKFIETNVRKGEEASRHQLPCLRLAKTKTTEKSNA